MRPILFALSLAALVALAAPAQDTKGDPKAKSEKKETSSKDRPPEVYEVAGKKIDAWIKEISSKDPSKREVAIRNVLAFGPKKAYQAVPDLIKELKKHTATTRIDMSVRITGANALAAILGSFEKVPEDDPDFLKHTQDAVAILRGFMKDSQTAVRHRAVQALPQIGPEARGAVDDVLKLLADPETWETRQAAVQTLTALTIDPKAGPSDKVVLALTKTMSTDPAHLVRFAAIQSMSVLGRFAEPTSKVRLIRTLEEVSLRDPEPANRVWAHMAIMTVQQKITDVHLAAVTKMLAHADLTVRLQATEALGMVGPPGKSAAPSVIAGLGDSEPQLVGASIAALVRMEAVSAVPQLQKIVDDPMRDEALKKAAGEAIKMIEEARTKKAEK